MLVLLAYVYANRITDMFNNERVRNGLGPITYDYNLHEDLKNFKEKGDYFYSVSNKTIYDVYQNKTRFLLKGDVLMDHEVFSGYKALGYWYLFRDTTNRNIPYIIGFRNGQRDCFNPDFSLKNAPVTKSGKHCSWAFQYIPWYNKPNQTSVACKTLNYVSPYTPNAQNKSFFCYIK